jgi:hypothetical protein
MEEVQPTVQNVFPPLEDSKGEAPLYSVIAKSEHEIKSRKWVVPMVLTLILISITAAAWLGSSIERPVQKLPVRADLTDLSQYRIKAKAAYVDGEIIRNGVKISEGQVFEEGDLVESRNGSKIILLFDDGSIVRIGEESRVILQQLKTTEMILDEKQGVVYARVNKSDEHKFFIKAGTVTIESMGTAFVVENKGDVKVNVLESEVKITGEGGAITKVIENQEWENKSQHTVNRDRKELLDDKFIQWNLKEDNLVD